MQTKTCLPSIKFLLDSPIDDGRFTPSHPTPRNDPSYHQPLPSIATINKQVTNPSYNPHPSNIKSLLSPPESPDMTHQNFHFDSYGAQVPNQLPKQEQCSCCVKPSSVYSAFTPIMNTYNQPAVSNYNPYLHPAQRYSSFSSTFQPLPISPYDRKLTISPHSLTRLNPSSLELQTAKHYPSPNGTSNGNRYQCGFCSKRFSRPSSLRIHIYSHTGEKPFVCTEPGCGRKFSVQSNMRRHLRVHRLGRPVKKTRYDGEVEGVKILGPAAMLRSY